jgi:hypothetical protein
MSINIERFYVFVSVYLGDDRMLIERFIEDPHHIEIQVRGEEGRGREERGREERGGERRERRGEEGRGEEGREEKRSEERRKKVEGWREMGKKGK